MKPKDTRKPLRWGETASAMYIQTAVEPTDVDKPNINRPLHNAIELVANIIGNQARDEGNANRSRTFLGPNLLMNKPLIADPMKFPRSNKDTKNKYNYTNEIAFE